MTVRLSLCLATYNRAAWIAETLDTIVPQLGETVELIVVDGASPDDTESVVRPYAERHANVTYIRETANSGVDADYDKAVGYARGDYCWLVADDDLLVPDAVARVLAALSDDPDLLVVDAEVRDLSMTHVLDAGRLPFSGMRTYDPGESDRLLADTGNALSFIGGTIIRRSLWLQRAREPYYGSLFIHVGVIFQQPLAGRAKALAEPLVQIRLGNAMWSARSFEIWMFKWPELVWSFEGVSDETKAAVVPRRPWRLPLRLFLFRANGAFSYAIYRRYFADHTIGSWRLVVLIASLAPGAVANLLASAMLALRGQGRTSGAYNLVTCSSYANRASRFLVRRLARPTWLESGR